MSFSMEHTVILRQPLSVVYPVLSDLKQIERVQLLNPNTNRFTLLPSDHVTLPPGGLAPLVSHNYTPEMNSLPWLREMDAVSYAESGETIRTGKIVERVKFKVEGTVSLLYGLVNSPLSMTCAQIVDDDARMVVFEGKVPATGSEELKLRTFEEVDLEDGTKGTQVRETVWVNGPIAVLYLVRVIGPGIQKRILEAYHKLFE
ncbi:hypothetical protein PILCRDRAFT_428095 [Piloderma croceum F 1598]|uniref:Uncharacterized protein n=1 Tax=Piloderma croceum (strain F 1598) TaxID=765440 RepID=A0A0C3FVP7_PILCF|nr:hypothetical protein PILCRDRAFT_428095 [Piloderma croceum F 1598]